MEGLSIRRLLAVAALCWILLLAITTAYVVAAPDGVVRTDSTYNALPWLNVIKFNPLLRGLEFVIGMAFGFVFLRGVRPKSANLLFVLGVAALAFAIALNGRIPYPILHTALLAPAFAAMIFSLAMQPPWARVLEGKVPVLLGDASYSLYLLHPIVLGFALQGRERAYSPVGVLVLAAVAVVISALVFLLIEQPARRWIRGKPKAAAAAVGA
jgi:peptidoglycan/LPS O-acetylase OafA/YrhL